MFDIGMSEIVLIAVVALVAIGPKDLPHVLHTAGRWIGKARVLAGEFQHHLDVMVRESEIDDMRKKVEAISLTDADIAIASTVDPTGVINRGLELPDFNDIGTPANVSGEIAQNEMASDNNAHPDKHASNP